MNKNNDAIFALILQGEGQLIAKTASGTGLPIKISPRVGRMNLKLRTCVIQWCKSNTYAALKNKTQEHKAARIAHPFGGLKI